MDTCDRTMPIPAKHQAAARCLVKGVVLAPCSYLHVPPSPCGLTEVTSNSAFPIAYEATALMPSRSGAVGRYHTFFVS